MNGRTDGRATDPRPTTHQTINVTHETTHLLRLARLPLLELLAHAGHHIEARVHRHLGLGRHHLVALARAPEALAALGVPYRRVGVDYGGSRFTSSSVPFAHEPPPVGGSQLHIHTHITPKRARPFTCCAPMMTQLRPKSFRSGAGSSPVNAPALAVSAEFCAATAAVLSDEMRWEGRRGWRSEVRG